MTEIKLQAVSSFGIEDWSGCAATQSYYLDYLIDKQMLEK